MVASNIAIIMCRRLHQSWGKTTETMTKSIRVSEKLIAIKEDLITLYSLIASLVLQGCKLFGKFNVLEMAMKLMVISQLSHSVA